MLLKSFTQLVCQQSTKSTLDSKLNISISPERSVSCQLQSISHWYFHVPVDPMDPVVSGRSDTVATMGGKQTFSRCCL